MIRQERSLWRTWPYSPRPLSGWLGLIPNRESPRGPSGSCLPGIQGWDQVNAHPHQQHILLTSHHLPWFLRFHGSSPVSPALDIRFFIPAPRSRPKTVRRNKVTTSWSRGESRSRIDWGSEIPGIRNEPYGNILLQRLLLFLSQCRDLCFPETRQRRWGGFDSSTTVLCMIDRVAKGYQE